jgi:VanZ family protein
VTPARVANLRSPFWLWAPVVLLMAAIFTASSIPDVGQLPGDMSDKSWHSIAYAILAGVVLRALSGGRLSGITWRVAGAAVLVTTMYGASDELHQSFVPGRTADRYDVLADAIGAGVAATAGWLAGAARRWGILDSSS